MAGKKQVKESLESRGYEETHAYVQMLIRPYCSKKRRKRKRKTSRIHRGM